MMVWETRWLILWKLGRSPNGAYEAHHANPPDVQEPLTPLAVLDSHPRQHGLSCTLEFHPLAEHFVNTAQQHPRNHQAADLIAPPFGHPLVSRPITRQAACPQRGLYQVIPQVHVRASTADMSVAAPAVRLLQPWRQPGESDQVLGSGKALHGPNPCQDRHG